MQNPNATELEAVITSTELNDVLRIQGAKINGALSDIAIDPTGIYCAKTGAPIGKMSKEILAKSLKSLGRERMQEALFSSFSLQPSPDWLYTAPEDLDALINSDPKGYACYCLNLLTSHYLTHIAITKKNRAQFAEHHWAMARAYQWINLLSGDLLDDLNDNLCGVLTYSPDASHFMLRELGRRVAMQPDLLARKAVEGSLIDILRNACDYALAAVGRMHEGKKRYEEISQTPADMARGPSQIRGQVKSRNRVKVDQDILAFDAEFKTELLTMSVNAQGKDKSVKHKQLTLRQRLQTNASQEVITDEMISALEDFDLSVLNETGPADDDRVEIRTIPRALIEPIVQAPIPETAPIPTQSLKEKLAAIREANKPAEKPKFNMRAIIERNARKS